MLMSKLVALLLLTNSLAAIGAPLRVTIILLKSRLSNSSVAALLVKLSSVRRTSKAEFVPELENVTSKAIVSSASPVVGVAVLATLMISGSKISTLTSLEVWELALSAVTVKSPAKVVPSWVLARFSTTALNSTTAYSLLSAPNSLVSSSTLLIVPRLNTGSVPEPNAPPVAVMGVAGVILSKLFSFPAILLIEVSLELIWPWSSATRATLALLSLRYLRPSGRASVNWRFSIVPSGSSTTKR